MENSKKSKPVAVEAIETKKIDPGQMEILNSTKSENSNSSSECKLPKNSKTLDIDSKACVENTTTQTGIGVKYKSTPIRKEAITQAPLKIAVPRENPSLSASVLNERPLVLAIHLVPSLPISLFEVFQEAIEAATGKPVVLLYEPRSERPVANGVTDIAILPPSGEWDDGELLPVSFCFEHRLNKENSPCIYADVIVTADRAPHVEEIMDLRGHRCSIPNRDEKLGAAALLFDHLHTKGEGPAFFGDLLDVNTQVTTLQMVAGNQAEVGILEGPVIKCHANSLPGVESVHILTSLGPLPPYRIMVNKAISNILVRKITDYLLNIDQNKEWVERFMPFGIVGFAKNSPELYRIADTKSVITSVPYY